MDKGKVVALCILVLALAFIYADQNRNEETSSGTSTDEPTQGHRPSGPSSPIIIPPILNLSIYQDENCTTELTSIDWGIIDVGQNKSQSIYLKNTGNGDVKATLYATDWVFKDYNETGLSSEYRQYFNLTWDKEGIVFKPSEVANATLTLSVSPLIENVTSFAFNIHLGWWK